MVLFRFDQVTYFLARHDLFFILGSSFYQDKHSDTVSRRLDQNCALWSVFMVLQRFYLVT